MALTGAIAEADIGPAPVIERHPIGCGLETIVPLPQVPPRLDRNAERLGGGAHRVERSSIRTRHDTGRATADQTGHEVVRLGSTANRQRPHRLGRTAHLPDYGLGMTHHQQHQTILAHRT